ncbi:MAG: cyclophilin-like family protein [Planctomycetota bacterium]
MSLRVTVRAGRVEFDLELDDSPVTTQIDRLVPFEGTCKLWGEDMNFPLPTRVDVGGARGSMSVNTGDVAYCPADATLRIYFGRTPFSGMEQPMPHKSVIVFGRVVGDYQVLQRIEEGARLKISRASSVPG